MSFASSAELMVQYVWSLQNYATIVSEPIYLRLLCRSLAIAALVTVLAILLAFPAAWIIARTKPKYRNTLLILLMIPWWSSYIVRAFAWYTMFGRSGLINRTVESAGVTSGPLDLFGFGLPAVILTELNLCLPLAVLPIYMVLERLDWNQIACARSLGAGPWRVLRRIVLPLSAHGIIAAAIFVFMPVAGTFIVPQLVGGVDGTMIGAIIASQFGAASNWALGAALAITLLTSLAGVLALLLVLRNRAPGAHA